MLNVLENPAHKWEDDRINDFVIFLDFRSTKRGHCHWLILGHVALTKINCITARDQSTVESGVTDGGKNTARSCQFSFELACVASVSIWLYRCSYLVSEQRKTGFGRARNKTRAIFRAFFDSHSSFFAPKPKGNACYAGYFWIREWTQQHKHEASSSKATTFKAIPEVPRKKNSS